MVTRFHKLQGGTGRWYWKVITMERWGATSAMITGGRKQAHVYHAPRCSSTDFYARSRHAGLAEVQLPINSLCPAREGLVASVEVQAGYRWGVWTGPYSQPICRAMQCRKVCVWVWTEGCCHSPKAAAVFIKCGWKKSLYKCMEPTFHFCAELDEDNDYWE